MRVRVIDLDGSITAQDRVLRHFKPEVYDLRRWGPRIRLCCRWKRFYRFERCLDRDLGADHQEPWISLLGSGDFHHVTLALLRRLRHPFNLLVLDKHPDWARGLPMAHCGSWLEHAARLPLVRRVFHLGGDQHFEGAMSWLAPKKLLRSNKIVVLPAVRRLEGGLWQDHPHQSLRRSFETLLDRDRLEELLVPYLDELERVPLYITLDKDALWMPESVANWDSGHLDLTEVQEILQFFLKAAGNDLIGMDIVGDWSRVDVHGMVRRLFHRLAHPRKSVDDDQARVCNERTNLMLLRFLQQDPAAESMMLSSRMVD